MITLQEIKDTLEAQFELEELDADGDNMNEITSVGNLEYLDDDTKIGNLLFSVEERVSGEDRGSDYHIINRVTREDGSDETFIKVQGYYSSYSGTEFDGLDSISIVEPVMVQVRQFKKVK